MCFKEDSFDTPLFHNHTTMKKLSFLLFASAALAFTACGGDDDSGGSSSGGGTTTPTVKIAKRVLAFPGAEGGASTITGGAGGAVYIVSSLEDSGTGTLREALNHTGKRTIVFATGGTIYLKSPLTIANGDVTIAGQTAPGGGITVAGYPVSMKASNVIIRYMRFRLGDLNIDQANFDADAGDGLGAKDCANIMIDHCSISWSTDECASFSRVKNLTVQYCIISESLKKSGHSKGNHGYGGIWGAANSTFHHNLLADHDSRNPRFDHQYVAKVAEYCGPIDYINNVVYNWGGNSTYGGEGSSTSFTINMQNNYYKPGPSSSHKDRLMELTSYCTNCISTGLAIPAKLYVSGNYVNGTANKDWDGIEKDSHDSRTWTDLVAMSKLSARNTTGLTALTKMESAMEAYETVLNYAGASLVRDAVDTRIINQVKNNNGALIDSQSDVGGYPTLQAGTALTDTDGDGIPDTWEKSNGLNPNKKDDGAMYMMTEKYTNLEVYLNSLVTNTFPSWAGASTVK